MSFEPGEDELDFGEITAAVAQVQRVQTPMTFSEGDVIHGRFTLKEHIGQGAMGEVWRVADDSMGREAAIKIVRIQDRVSAAERDELVARVFREAIAAQKAGERCIHIVRIYDIASLPSGDPFIVMEFLDGSTVRQWMNLCGAVEWQTVREVALQCAKALHALHKNGFIHRDIKPDNIFALEDDENPRVPFIRLIDFGLAKDLEAGKLTRTAFSIGTQRYMAPEQFLKQTAVQKSDIFSLGVILFEALTERNPLPADANQLANQYRSGMPSVGQFAPDLPQWFEALIDRCLSTKAAHRPTANELINSLTRGAESSFAAPILADIQEVLELDELEDLPELPEDAIDLAPLPKLPEPEIAEPKLRLDAIDPAPLPELVDVAGEDATAPLLELTSLTTAPPDPAPVSIGTETDADFADERPLRAYSPRPPEAPRSSVPMALALFAGLALIAGVLASKSEPEALPPTAPSISAEPELAFKARGPVESDDFPKGAPRTAPASVETVAEAPASAPPSAPPTTAAVTTAKERPAKRSKRRTAGRRSKPRKGLAKSFAQVRDSALARSGQPVLAATAAPIYAGRVEYDDDAGAQFGIGKRKKKSVAAQLPVGTLMSGVLLSGISSSAHDVVLARLRKPVVVNEKIILKAGDILKGRSRNNFERVFIRFTEARRGSQVIKFSGNATTAGQPGLPANKKVIPSEERGTNVVARGALTTAGGVAARLGGGVAGELANDVAREGVTEVRPDFRERDPFVLTVAKGVRFNVIVVGK